MVGMLEDMIEMLDAFQNTLVILAGAILDLARSDTGRERRLVELERRVRQLERRSN